MSQSSIAAALFRLVELRAGVIRIDGLDIASVGLHTLRGRLAIVSQVMCALECVVVCCSVLQCVAVWCRALQCTARAVGEVGKCIAGDVCVAVCCGVLRCVAVCCSVLQCVAVCCSVL